MRRRTFLAAVGASAAAALWPRLIRNAFADASFDVPGARRTAPGLPSAQTRALQASKPLFVIVVPSDDAKKYERGGAWGEYLNHGTAAEIAPLAGVEVACATMADLSKLAPEVTGEPLAVIVHLDGTIQVVDGPLPQFRGSGRMMEDGSGEDAVVEKRIRAVSNLVHRALPPVADVPAAAAQVVKSLRQSPPAGSHWASHSGCGPAVVEGLKDDDNVGYGCGMGHVPAKSSRFLYFFAKTPRQMEQEYIAAKDKKAPRR
ncbi:MAG: putative secreted protein [Myxococcales bacterium]|nr:putative secreted protein [Myxococcales bacterium]